MPNHSEVKHSKPLLKIVPMNLTSETSAPVIHRVLDASEPRITGLAIALLIISVWAISLCFFLTSVPVEETSLLWKALAILCQTFLYTGLFITAHDAMHGAVFPKHRQINYLIGSLAMLLYGCFFYEPLLKKHSQHHYSPASESDPDFHDGSHKNVVAWYVYFMFRYWSWWRLGRLIVIYHSMHILLNIDYGNLILFWVIPLILSSMQLFYFGTFVPHQEPIDGYQNSFRAKSIYRPLLWSFLTCYHFGYHQEHHMYPDIPWWKLPLIITQR